MSGRARTTIDASANASATATTSASEPIETRGRAADGGVGGGGGGQVPRSATATAPPCSWPSISAEATGAYAGASVRPGDQTCQSEVAAPMSADTRTPRGSAPQ